VARRNGLLDWPGSRARREAPRAFRSDLPVLRTSDRHEFNRHFMRFRLRHEDIKLASITGSVATVCRLRCQQVADGVPRQIAGSASRRVIKTEMI
jgi:hypothetical protein